MSSFQLADVETFRPDIGVVTNLAPDHLDRYESVEAYYADKARMLERANVDSVWVLPAADTLVTNWMGDTPGSRFFFGEEEDTGTHAFSMQGFLTLRVDDSISRLMSDAELPLLGRHNLRNALAAALTASLAGASSQGIATGLRRARPLPHRLEPVIERGGVLWVNDSKATNVAATRSALSSLSRPVVLLVGGKDKGEDFSGLLPADATVKAVLSYGAAGGRISSEVAVAEFVPGDLRAVTTRASSIAESGDVILLSPACSSFDMFESYEERGRHFSELAREAA